MINSLPPKEHLKTVYGEYLTLAKQLVTRCREMDAQGMGKIRKTFAIMRLPLMREIINRTADDNAEMRMRGIKKIPNDYFKNDAGELDPVVAKATAEMKDCVSYFGQQCGHLGIAAFGLKVEAGIALRRMGIKSTHSRMFAAPTP